MKIEEYLKKLIEVDPIRIKYYKYLQSKNK